MRGLPEQKHLLRTIFLRGMQSYDEMTVFLGSASATALEGLIMSLKSALIMSPMLRFFTSKTFLRMCWSLKQIKWNFVFQTRQPELSICNH